MNWTDWTVIIILIISILTAYKVGFIKTCFDFFSTIISLVMAYKLYPIMSKFLRDSGWFDTLKLSIGTTMNIEEKTKELTLSAQNSLINNLELPNFLKSALIENNNTEVYNILNVSQIEDYISGYIANICINIISIILVFLVVFMIVKLIAGFLDLASKLPIINSINKIAGSILGLAKGVLIIWILCMVITFFYSNPALHPVLLAIQESSIAKIFYNNNWLIFMVTQIFV